MGRADVRALALAAAGLASALALGASADGATPRRADARAVDALYKRSLDLAQALTEAASGAVAQVNGGGSSATLDCLETLRDAAGQVSDQLLDVRDVVSLAARLRAAGDQRRGAAAARRAIAGALEVLPVERHQADATARLCGPEGQTQSRARDLGQLIDDATAELSKLKG